MDSSEEQRSSIMPQHELTFRTVTNIAISQELIINFSNLGFVFRRREKQRPIAYWRETGYKCFVV